MSTFIGLFANDISCIAYGLLISLAIVAIVSLVLYIKKKDSLVTIPSIICITILFIVLLSNMSVMVGAIKVKGIANRSIDAIEQFDNVINPTNLNNIGELILDGDYMEAVQQVSQASEEVDINNLLEIKNQLGDNWDLLKHYLDAADINVSMLFLSPTQTIEKFDSKMNYTIIGNILWSALFIGITFFVGIKGTNKSKQYQRKRSTYSSRINHHNDDF